MGARGEGGKPDADLTVAWSQAIFEDSTLGVGVAYQRSIYKRRRGLAGHLFPADPKRRAIVLGLAAASGASLLLGLAVFWQSDSRTTEQTVQVEVSENAGTARRASLAPPSDLPFEPRVLPSVAEREARVAGDPDSVSGWRSITVAPGDSLSLVFNRIGASRHDLQAILDIDKEVLKNLTNLSPGQTFRFKLAGDKVEGMVFEKDYLTSVRVNRKGEKFVAEWMREKPEIREAVARAEITHSLFIDGQRAGLSDKTLMEFIGVFGWDVDFLRELQRGDRFSVVFEEIFKDGEKVATGRILAAEFINQGKRLRALLYENSDGISGYYTDKGEAMRKAFLRTPVNFTRISSRFSLARKHPILNRIRAHRGVDYSAPTGTPIQAVADGKVSFAGWKGGYGKVVQLQHGSTYSTLYGHMSNFARGMRSGQSVRQGQTIGYVGRTGLATGPHLHYEFHINGVHRDPLAVKLPNALPLDKKYMADFLLRATPLVARLEKIGDELEGTDTMVADIEKSSVRKPKPAER